MFYPYYLKTLSSPSGQIILIAETSKDAEIGIIVSLVDVEKCSKKTIKTFNEFIVPLFVWANETVCCVAFRFELFIFNYGNLITDHRFTSTISKIEISSNELLVLESSTLWRIKMTAYELPEEISTDILSFTSLNKTLIFLTTTKHILTYVYNACLVEKVFWPLEHSDVPQMKLSNDDILIVSGETAQNNGTTFFCIAWLELPSLNIIKKKAINLKNQLGWPGTKWYVTAQNSVVFLGEKNSNRSLWLVSLTNDLIIKIGPKNIEVIDAIVTENNGEIFITGSPLNYKSKLETWILTSNQNRIGQFKWQTIQKGINNNLTINYAASKVYFTSSHKSLVSELLFFEKDKALTKKLINKQGSKISYSSIELNNNPCLVIGSGQRNAIIYVQGPHRRFVAGVQSLFFHHAIISVLETIIDSDSILICLNPPGVSEMGTKLRSTALKWDTETSDCLIEVYDDLKKQGFDKISVVCSSLGAIPAIRFLNKRICYRSVLISPVITPKLDTLKNWQFLFSDCINKRDCSIAIQTPILIFHGESDSIVNPYVVLNFFGKLINKTSNNCISFPREGHIFRKPSTWNQIAEILANFFDKEDE